MPAFKRSSAPTSINTTPAAASEKQAHDVQSPPLSPLLNVREDKDALAIAHDRQKYLKALDRARNKARKAFSSVTHGNGTTPTTGRRSNSKTRGGLQQQRHHHHGAQERSVTVGDEDWVATSEEGVTPVNYIASSEYFSDARSVEVRLADLVQTKKARKKGGLGGDYEFIPHIRSVIVLDDSANGAGMGRKARDMVLDDENDTWECIDDDTAVGKQKVTYASIAAAALASQ